MDDLPRRQRVTHKPVTVVPEEGRPGEEVEGGERHGSRAEGRVRVRLEERVHEEERERAWRARWVCGQEIRLRASSLAFDRPR